MSAELSGHCRSDAKGIFAWSIIHPFFPLLEGSFQGIIDNRIQLVGVCLDEVKIEDFVGVVFGFPLLCLLDIFLFMCTALDIFEGSPKVVLTTVSFMFLLFE